MDRNVRIEYRWGEGDYHKAAEELITVAPDVLLASGNPAVIALQSLTRSVPIVFVNGVDPVGSGFVASLARPGGNSTGFTLFEYSIVGKWIELLKQISPNLQHAGILRNPTTPAGIGQFGVIQTIAGVAPMPRAYGSMHRSF